MNEFSYNPGLLTSYLLGELSTAERDRFEEEYFCNNEVFVALLDAKDQLISDYLDGKLSDAERQRFERHFLTLPDRKREVELASFLRPKPEPQVEKAHPVTAGKPSWRKVLFSFVGAHQSQIGLAAAILIIGSVVGWQLMRSSPEPGSVSMSKSSERIPAGQVVVSLFLKPSSRRSSSQERTANVGRATQTIDLNFEVGDEIFRNYQGSLRNKQGGVEILSDNSLKAIKNEAGKTIVNWQVPASRLQVDDYTVSLKGITPDGSNPRVGDYDFDVRPENPPPGK